MNIQEPGLRMRFVEAMSRVACTVHLVTTDGPAGRAGVTVSAMASVSADGDRPTLLVCLNRANASTAAVLANGVFCVNVLRDGQSGLSESFAGSRKGEDKFSQGRWTSHVTGAPRLADALVAFDCRLTAHNSIGSHAVLFGAVEDVFLSGQGMPLLYVGRAYAVPRPD